MKTLILPTLVILCFVVTLGAQEKHPLEASGGVSAFSLGEGASRSPSYGLPVDETFQIFAHALAGRMTQALDGDPHSGIGFGLGGGVDRRLSKHVAGRLFADWLKGKVQSS